MIRNGDRLILVDAFCGAGGCTKGYQQAGFYVIGVDNTRQPRYCGDEFYQMDVFEFLQNHPRAKDAVAFSASPPCQFATSLRKLWKANLDYDALHPNLIPATRDALLATGKPYVIENVMGAKNHLRNPVMLCGTFFDLRVYRHRLFETSFSLPQPVHKPHRDKTPSAGRGVSPKGFISVSGTGGITKVGRPVPEGGFISVAGHFSGVEYARKAMGISWMVQKELAQAIPPAYTHWIGVRLMEYLKPKRTMLQQLMQRHYELTSTTQYQRLVQGSFEEV